MTTDEDLIDRARRGDPGAFGTLMIRHGGQLRAYCAAHCPNPADRDDLTQLVMIRVWRGMAGFDHRSGFSTWLYRIVANTAATEWGKRARLPRPVRDPTEYTRETVRSPADDVVLRNTVDTALGTLGRNFRLVVELVDRYGFAPTDVARICGIPESTVRTRLWRARTVLRTALTAVN